MFMAFHTTERRRPWLIAIFSAALALGGALLLFAR